MAAGDVPPDGRPLLDAVHPARAGCRAAAAPSSCAGPAPSYRRYRAPGARPCPGAPGCGTRWSGWAPTAPTAPCGRRIGGCDRRPGARPRRRGACGRRPLQLHYRVQLRLPLDAATAPCSPPTGGRGYSLQPGARWRRRCATSPRTSARPGSPTRSTPTRCRPATRRLRPGTAAYWTALARAKYLVNNVNFDRRLVKRPGQVLSRPSTAPRSSTWASTSRTARRPPRDHGLRPAAAATSTSGTTCCRPTATPPWSGSASTRRATPRWSTATRATTSSSRATAEDVARLRERLGIPQGTHRHPVRADPPRLPRAPSATASTWSGCCARLGPRFVVLARAHYCVRRPALTPAPATRGSSTSSAHPSVE